jgi:hypothetical protein
MPKYDTQTPSTIGDLIKSINIDVSGTSEFRKFQQLYHNDRIAFVHDVMPVLSDTIALYQEEILGYFDEGVSRVAVRGPHGLGKTLVAAVLVHHGVLTCTADAKIPTTASAWRQLEKYLWPEIHKLGKFIAWPVVGRPPYDMGTEFLKLAINMKDRDASAFALASDDHTTLEGAHATYILFVFDEAKTIPVPTWDALEGAFSTEGLSYDHEAIAFAISTPGDPSGRFYDIHARVPGYEDWLTRHVTIDEAVAAGRISGHWVEQRRRQWGEDNPVFQNRVLGEFADNAEDGVIPLSWVRSAIGRWKDWDATGRPKSGSETTWCGVDVARMGRDETVIALRSAYTLEKLYVVRKSPTTQTAGKVTQLARNAIINIEMDPMGSAVYDMLKENGLPNVRPVHPNGKTFKRDKSGELQFLNTRAAMWWNMRELLDPDNGTGIRLVPDDRLIADLTTPRWLITSSGKIKIEAKKDIKVRLGRSTDRGDAVCLAFWQSSGGGGVVI